MEIMGLLTLLVICSLCISSTPQETEPPTTTSEPTTTPHATTPSPTAPTPTTPAPINEEKNYCVEKEIPENLMQKILYIDANNKLNQTERLIIDKSKELLDSDIPEKIVGELLIDTAYRIGGESGIEYLMQNIGTSLFKKMIEDELIENHEIRLIEKSFTYSGLQDQLKVLNDKASENFLKTYKVVLYNSINARAEPERFLYSKIDEHLDEFDIGEKGFLYYSNGVLKVDDKNLYIKWLDSDYDPFNYRQGMLELIEERGCKLVIDRGGDDQKEESKCFSKFIGKSTDIPFVTKYCSVKPIEDKFKNTSNDSRIKLNFDIHGFNGLGYEQIFDIYITFFQKNQE